MGWENIVAFLESIATEPTTPTGKKGSCCAPSDKRECANCGTPEGHPGVALLTCARCKLVLYCGTACQVQHWKEGGHKKQCITLSDRTVKAAEAPKQRASIDGAKCVICQEPLSSGATSSLSCGHTLHTKCIESLKKSNGVARLCRCVVVSCDMRSNTLH